MKESKITYSGGAIAKNTIYNLLGYGIPVLLAIVIIPLLVKGLGEERFGILNLVWGVIGYFSFFDLGIGRAQTKIIAEKIGTNNTEEIPSIFWTSFFLMLCISFFGTVILLVLAHYLVYSFFNISKDIQTETLNAFYLLALSIPIVTTTAGVRGILEAYQKFGIINVIRTILGISSFLGPLLCLFFTKDLFWIVAFFIVIRIVILSLYMNQCFKINNKIKGKLLFKSKLIKPLLKLGGWMSVSNIIVPLIVYLDRFLIGALVSATAIAFYATPYEAVTKLLLVPGALVAVLFPAISANYLNNPDFTKRLAQRAIKYIFLILFPIIFLIITYAKTGMNLWLGQKFADNSTLILQLLAMGVLLNSIAYIPFTFLEGIGRPDITAKVNLVELPVYLLIMWIVIKHYGINGAAFIWLLRMFADAMILFFFAKRQISIHFKFNFKPGYLYIFLLVVASIIPVLITNLIIKSILVLMILIAFLIVTWKYFLSNEEKTFLTSYLKMYSRINILENKNSCK